MIVPKVLALTASILGAFLLYTILSSLAPSSPPCVHNIACYLLPLPLNRSIELQDRLTQIRDNFSHTTSIAHHYHSLIHNHTAFSQNALLLAKNFQTYLQQLTKEVALRHQDHEVILAVKEAETQFLECKAQIEGNSSQECTHNWNSYLQCFQQVKSVRDHLQILLATEQDLQKRIAASIEQPKQDDPEKRPEFVAQRVYNESMLANQKTLRELRAKIQSSQLRLNEIREQRDRSSERAQLKQHAYRECWQNRRIHRHCEEISEQVKNISTGTLEQLKLQIEAKNRLMQEMREMMLRMGKGDNRKMPEHWNEMYREHLEEYKQMLKDYIYNTQMERKACGCSEQEEKTLLQQLENQKKSIVDAQLQISSLTRDIGTLKISVTQKQQQKAKIIADYQKALRDYQTNAPQFRQSQLIRLKKQLDRNRINLLRLQADYNSINLSCNDIKHALTSTLKDINLAEQCLAKKEYLLKLRSQTAQYLKPERSLMKLRESKHKLAEALKAFQP